MIINVSMSLFYIKKSYMLKIFTDEMTSGIPFEIIQAGGRGEWGVGMKPAWL